MDPFSAYIFTYAVGSDVWLGKLTSSASVLISFVAPSGQSLVLRVKHCGGQNPSHALEVTLGRTTIQLEPSSKSKSLLTIDDITLHPIQDPGTSESDSDHTGLSFKPGVRNDIFIHFGFRWNWRQHFLHDIELLDESGFEKW